MTPSGRLIVATLLAISCGSSSPSIDASVGDGSSNGDGGIDAPPVSHAPCATCCDPINQTGCDAGQACYHVATFHTGNMDTYCAPVGTGPLGFYCDIDSDCAAGLTCYPNTADRLCRKFCVADADCPSTAGMSHCALSPQPGNPYGICYGNR